MSAPEENMQEEYNKAKRLGEKQWHMATRDGRYPYLPALDVMVPDINALSEYPIGLVEIPIDMIAGTKTQGRQNAFSTGFMPILSDKSEFATKWGKLYTAQIEEGIRDPIKVYEYMQRFYVEEGNKRVSVLKYLGVPTILGDVIRVKPAPSEDKEYRIYKEFEAFYDVAPIYAITFSEEGRYRLLAEKFGQNLEDVWPVEVLETLRSAYQYFSEIYLEKGGGHLDITVADALLIYLNIYSADSLLEESRAVLKRRIERIWNEFLVETNADSVALINTPEEKEKSKNLLTGLGDILKKPDYTEDHPLKIGFIYEKTAENSRWTYGHELGRNHLEETFGNLVRTVKYENCMTEEDIKNAVEAAHADAVDVIVTISPSQMAETLRAAIAYPDIRFLNCSINLPHSAVRTYYGRMYEAKFLIGALAASVAENHKIGYLADQPIYGTIAGINAFAIGAALADPFARIYLAWDSTENTDWRAEMWNAGVRIQSGPDLIKPEEAGREYGLYRIGDDGSLFNLAMPVWDWGRYYELIFEEILKGSWSKKDVPGGQAVNYWYGMSSGVIDVILSNKISYYSKKLVGILKRAIIADTLSPFDGELHAQGGLIKEADSPRLTNEQIITMDWLNDNVIGRMPKLGEISDETAKETVKVSGVREAKE